MLKDTDKLVKTVHQQNKFNKAENIEQTLFYNLLMNQGGDTPIYPVLRSSSSVKALTC